MPTTWVALPAGMAPVTTVEPLPRKLKVWLDVLLLVKPALRFNMAPPVSVLAMVLSLAPASMMTALVKVMDLSPANTPEALLAMVSGTAVLRAEP